MARRRGDSPMRADALTRAEDAVCAARRALLAAVDACVVADEVALQKHAAATRRFVGACRRVAIEVSDAEVLRACNRIVVILEGLTP